MNFVDQTIPILDVTIELTYQDDTTEEFLLQAPNADDPFQFGFRRINILPAYRDGNFTVQKGFEKYQFFCDLSYETHQMNLWKLLIAKHILLKIPPAFTTTPNDDYTKINVFLENESALRSWLNGHVIAGSGTTFAEANPVPSGGVNLTFVGITPFTEREFLGDDLNPDDEDGSFLQWENALPQEQVFDIEWRGNPSSTSNDDWLVTYSLGASQGGIEVEDNATIELLSCTFLIDLHAQSTQINPFNVRASVRYDGVIQDQFIGEFTDGCDAGDGLDASGSLNVAGEYVIGGVENAVLGGDIIRATGGFNFTTLGPCGKQLGRMFARVYIPEGFVKKQDYESGSFKITVT